MELGPNGVTSGSGAPKRVLSEEAITFKRLRQIEYYYQDRQAMLCKHNPPDSTHTKGIVFCKHNSFGVGSANSPKHAPLRKPPRTQP